MRTILYFLLLLGGLLVASVKELSGTGENDGAAGLIIFVNNSPGELFLNCENRDFVIVPGDSLSLACQPGHPLIYSAIAKGPHLLPVDLGFQKVNSVLPGAVQRVLLDVPEDYVFITVQNLSSDTIRQILFYTSAGTGSRLAGRVEGLQITKTGRPVPIGYFPLGFDRLALSCSGEQDPLLPENGAAWYFGDFSGMVYPIPPFLPLPAYKAGPNQVLQLKVP